MSTRRVRATALLLATVLGASGSGCSLLLVTRPPDGPIDPSARLDCTPPTTQAPGSDLVAGYLAVAAGAVVAVLGITGGPGCHDGGTCASTATTRKQLGLGLGLVALGYAAMRSGGEALPASAPASSAPATPGISIGETCATDAECQAGLACQYGRCAVAPAR